MTLDVKKSNSSNETPNVITVGVEKYGLKQKQSKRWQHAQSRHGPFFENIFFEKFEKSLPFFEKFEKNSKKTCFTN
jgi:hypothetical protein